jgi:hypothetical protein
MLFRVIVAAQANGWSVLVEDPGSGQALPGIPRSLGRVVDLGNPTRFFPLPPPAEAQALPPTAPHRALCQPTGADALSALLAALSRGESGDDGAETLGRYLFSVLFGEALWADILGSADGQPVELALCWDATELSLHRLPWELLHGPDRFFVQEPGSTLMRCVRGAGGPAGPIELVLPTQVLFVIGADLNSQLARGAVEYLGVLQGLCPELSGLSYRMLIRPTAEALETAVGRLRPSVVHLICPVDLQSETPTIFLTGTAAPSIDSARLLQALRGNNGDQPLPIVILSSGRAIGPTPAPQPAIPLAAKLIQSGVPLVAGLSGSVADQSCRLAAVHLYNVLQQPGQLDLVMAVARARRAGLPRVADDDAAGSIMHRGVAPWTRIDWGLPFLMLPETAPTITIATAAGQAGAVAGPQQYMQEKLLLRRHPVLCGGAEQLAEYHLLMADATYQRAVTGGPEVQALVIADENVDVQAYGTAKFGLSRLLQEYAAEAMRAGHIPLLISPHFPELRDRNWAMEPIEFARCLQDVAYATSKYLATPAALLTLRDLSNVWRNKQTLLPPQLSQIPEIDAIYNDDPNAQDVLAVAFRRDIIRLLDAQQSLGTDAFTPLERGLRELRQRIPQDAQPGSTYQQLLLFEARLLGNITEARTYGDTGALQNGRNQILASLNVLALSTIQETFNDLSALLPASSERRRVVLLIDDVHRLGKAADFLFDRILNDDMMSALREQLRVVLTYSARQGQGNPATAHRMTKWLGEFARVRPVRVGLFPEPIEDRMAYDQLLLHWRDSMTGQRVRLIPSEERARDVAYLYRQLRREVRRIPSLLGSERVAGIVESLIQPSAAAGPIAPEDDIWALRLDDDEAALAATI